MQSRIAGHQTRQPVKTCHNIRLLLAYDGGAFHGWQIQPGRPTVQGTVRDAIERITGEQLKLIGSGRTDAGTHARGMVANFITASQMPLTAWSPALNRLLPPEIRVLSARRVPLEFHARLAASSKVYRYQIYRGAVMPPHLAREHFHFPYPLVLTLMETAARSFVGEHDFASFAAHSGREVASSCTPGVGADSEIAGGNAEGLPIHTVRRIMRCELKSRGRQLLVTVEGNGFLHHMVRNMVGTLLEMGRGRISLEQFRDLFERRDRTLAGFTAPACGLILLRVRY